MSLPITLNGENYGKVRKVSDGIYVKSDWAEVLIPYESESQKSMAVRMSEIQETLAATDYRAAKYAEGLYTEEEYAPYKAERQALRDEYNALAAQYTPPVYTEDQLEMAKKLFLDKDLQMRKDATGNPFIEPLDPSVFMD